MIALLLVCAAAWPVIEVSAKPLDIPGPPGSHAFGTAVAVLPNGNFVVTDPYAQNGAMNVGTVFLYRPDGTLINFFSGSTTDDHVGIGGIFVLANGNFVIASPDWSNDGAAGAGAVTWVDGSGGLSGSVSPSNSLVGSAANDHVGADANGYANVIALPGGNYVVPSPNWNNAAGAATWANGGTGLSGVVSPANSLVGPVAGDKVGGLDSITVLTNGNYVVASQSWNGGAGAVTWVSRNNGLSGPVSAENSLVGSVATDNIGEHAYALSNGNYVVASPAWNSGRGAVTWGDGHNGLRGFVSPGNSMVGSAPNDRVGSPWVTPLTNGNYVVGSRFWSAGMGAVSWANGTSGLTGEVSAGNSLVGTQAGDDVGNIYALANGNYVVASSNWRRGTNVGAVTWGNGITGTTGAVSLDNSLVGNEVQVPYGSVSINVVPLPNGNYVVGRPGWNNGAAVGAGAVTWADGTKGISGAISPANSLVGSSSGDRIGGSYPNRVTALTNGNYVVSSPDWSNGSAAAAGAATWINGRTGLSGEISAANSLVGLYANDHVGSGGATALRNGNFVISSGWSLTVPQQLGYSITPGIGAATWGNGITGITGSIGVANSLIGSQAGDNVAFQVIALSTGDYAVVSPSWANGHAKGAGAVTWADGGTGLSGVVSAANSLIGSTTDDTIGSTHFGWFDSPKYVFGVTALSGGSYAVLSPDWQDGQMGGGAVSLGSRGGVPIGPVSTSNSAQGTVPFQNSYVSYMPAYDSERDQLIVGFPASNRVSIIKGNNSAVAALNVDQHGLTGSWYNPATGGQGIEMEMYPDLAGPGEGVLFAGWFTFDVAAAGGQRWYALQGSTNDTTTVTLDIATGYAGNFAAPPAVTGTIVGQAAIRFFDCNNATITYNFSDGSGRTGSIPLARLTANVTCATAGDNGTVPSDYLLSGSWFDAATAGQGLIFDFNPAQPYLFAAWYTFSPNGTQSGGPGSQRWYTLQSGQVPHGTTALSGIGIYTATDGVFNDPATTTTNQVGTANITFGSCNAMTVSYTFTSGDNQGRSGTMHLTRTGPTPAGCSL